MDLCITDCRIVNTPLSVPILPCYLIDSHVDIEVKFKTNLNDLIISRIIEQNVTMSVPPKV